MSKYIITTNRLGLRNWHDTDIEPAAKMCGDKDVMEFFPDLWTKQRTKNFIMVMQHHFKEHGYCYFAVDRLDTNTFIGFIGLYDQTFESNFTPCVDIGWRLLKSEWNKGYATEGARACLDFAFAELNLKEVYALAPELNVKSQRVMQKIGMKYHSNFKHPKINKDSPLRKCILYCSKHKNL